MAPSSATVCDAWNNAECEGTPYCPPRCPRFVDDEGVPMLVRPFDEDGESLIELYESLDSDSRTMGLPPVERPRLEEWLDGLLDRGWNLVALDDDRVVGHVAVVPASADAPEFVIFVHQDYRGRGVGGELLRQLVAYAADRGHAELTLHVSKNNRRAIAVYENVGFEVVERELSELGMALSLRRPIAERVRRPPAERG